jgi:uncharacterized protein with WD repeat
MSKVQTDNSYLEEKIILRMETLSNINKDKVVVLDCYSGEGLIWDEIIKRSSKKINVLRIDAKKDKKGIYLKGENMKFIKSLNLNDFDIVDLDAYGMPYFQLIELFKQKYKGFIHVTFIQSVMGNLPNSFLFNLGYTKKMVEKCRTLFSKNGMEKMLRFLSIYGIKEVTGYFFDRKNYFYFNANIW